MHKDIPYHCKRSFSFLLDDFHLTSIETITAEVATDRTITIFLVEGMRRLADMLLRLHPGVRVVSMDEDENGVVNFLDILDEILSIEKHSYIASSFEVKELPIPESFIFDMGTIVSLLSCSTQEACEYAIRFLTLCCREEENSAKYLAVTLVDDENEDPALYGEFVLETLIFEGRLTLQEFH